ncbi:hypothetical protein RHS01_10036 [Rhizoctonia solani]|uniref:Uncharacterized protein n=1 Tax=Rhizoctonia solani TaxID=456999 RepID=A0A8H7LXL1_9AGAM|nr:hypothetical protein RHS01_10036 [Rhizoctonia solani]
MRRTFISIALAPTRDNPCSLPPLSIRQDLRKKKRKSSNIFTHLADIMAKPSKSQPATKPSKPPKPILSNAEKVARRENTATYKNAKASTLASAAPRKGPRYHDADDDKRRAETTQTTMQTTTRRLMVVIIGIAATATSATRYNILDRPEGNLKRLDIHMEMDGPDNKTLFKGIQNYVRTVVRHVSCNLPKCTYVKLTDEQRGSINAQVYNAYPIMRRYRDNWAVKELTIRALTHQRDHQARIEKAGGQVAWCNKLKAQREAKKAGNASTRKGKGKARSEPDPSSSTSEGPSNKARGAPRSDLFELTIIFRTSPRLFLRTSLMTVILPRRQLNQTQAQTQAPGENPTHVEDSEEEASNKAPLPAPGPSSSGQKTKDKSSKRTAKAASTEESDEDEPTSVLKPLRVKRKAEDAPAVPNHTPKKARAQLVESSEDENIGGPKPSSSKSKGKGVAREPVRQVTPAEVTSDDGEPAPALERPALKQKTKESQKNKVREQLIENDSEPGTISQSAKGKNKGTKVRNLSARQLDGCLQHAPRPAEVEEPASAEADLEEATQEYPPTVASITPAPAAAPRLGSDALEAGTREHDSDEDIPVPKPAQKRARPSPPPAASPPAITDDESGKGANTQKAPPAKKGRKTATLAAVDDEMVGPSAAVESQAAPKGKRGRQAKQELINATDALLSDTPPVPGRKTRKSTKANKR